MAVTTIKFTDVVGSEDTTVTVLPGTYQKANRPDIVQANNEPPLAKGVGYNGSVEVLITDTFSFSDAIGLVSPANSGNFGGTATGKVYTVHENGSTPIAYGCLLDVQMFGPGAQKVKIMWKGTKSST